MTRAQAIEQVWDLYDLRWNEYGGKREEHAADAIAMLRAFGIADQEILDSLPSWVKPLDLSSSMLSGLWPQ